MSAPARVPLSASDATLTMWRIAATENVEALKDVLVQGADINASDIDGMTALMRAAEFGRPRMAQALIERGANLDAVRADGFTPLLLAAFFGHSEVVKLLVEAGADVSCTTRFDTSAEMWAKARTFYGVVRYLREARAKVTIANPATEESLLADSVTSADVEEQAKLPATPVIASALFSPELVASNLCSEVCEPESVELDEIPLLDEHPEIKPVRLLDSFPPEPAATLPQNSEQQTRTLSESPETWNLVHERPDECHEIEEYLLPSEELLVSETLEALITSEELEGHANMQVTPVSVSPFLEPELFASDLSEQEYEAGSVELDEIPTLDEQPVIKSAPLLHLSTPETAATRPQNSMPQIRTLSEPPDIWDLVHETPAEFSPGSAFFTRLTSGAVPVVLGVLFLLLAGLGTYWFLKDRREPGAPIPQKQTQASMDHKPLPPSTSAAVPSKSQIVQPAAVATETSAPPAAAATETSAPPAAAEINTQPQESASVIDGVTTQPVYRRSGSRNRAKKNLDTGEVGVTPTEGVSRDSEGVAKNDSIRSRSTSVPNSDQPVAPKKNATSTVAPQVIAPSPQPAPPKGKVIQWP